MTANSWQNKNHERPNEKVKAFFIGRQSPGVILESCCCRNVFECSLVYTHTLIVVRLVHDVCELVRILLASTLVSMLARVATTWCEYVTSA
jgi:hypothetical protein